MTDTDRQLLPDEKVWTIGSMAAVFKDGKWKDSLIEYKILVCPNLECGNIDTDLISIYSTDLDTCRWYGNPLQNPLMTETPLFTDAKSVYTESSEIPDEAECRVCGEMWQVSPATHYYDFG